MKQHSSNTSRPPSADQKGSRSPNNYNGREKNDRKAGGQKGHKGTTLTKASVEEKIKSGRCLPETRNTGDTSVVNFLTKYDIDLDVKSLITEVRIYADVAGHFSIPNEYHSDVVYGPNVKALAVTLYSEGVMSNDRIAAFLNAVNGEELELSTGNVYQFCRSLSENAARSIKYLEEELLNQHVVATDATNVTINGKQCFTRNFSIAGTALYYAILTIIESLKRRKVPMIENIKKLFLGTPAIF